METATLFLTALEILIIPFLLWHLNSRTTKQIEELKIKNDLKIQTYKKLFDIFNSILVKDNSANWNPKNRIDLVTDLLKYAPDEIVNKFALFWNEAKKGDMKKVNLSALYEEILLLIREDLGHKNSKINRKTVIELLLSE
jgi:hypothetical protein